MRALFGVGIVLAALAGGGVQAEESKAIAIGGGPQLFVDDHLIAAKTDVKRTIHACRKLPHPVVEPEHPWEGMRVYVYGTVYRDPSTGQFRMWYMSNPTTGKRDPRLTWARGALVLYATSQDGVRWKKPKLGLYAFNGSKTNNIVYGMDSPSLIVEPNHPDPKRRYVMLGYTRKHGVKSGGGIALSEDGMHWQGRPFGPLFRSHDTMTLAKDPKTGEYFAFHKSNPKIRGYHRRSVALTTSKDLKHWTERKLVMAADGKDDTWATEPEQRTEIYNMSAFPYGDRWLGLITVFRKKRRLKESEPYQSRDDGPIHVQLVYSADGRDWHRLEQREPVIPNAPHGYDAGCILGVTNTPVFVEDEVWFYYTAITTTHGGALPTKRITVARAAWRRDGFVSTDAGRREGVIETKPIAPKGDRLFVNVDAADGKLVVEVLDAKGNPLPGYAGSDCSPVRGDSISQVVRWRQSDRLPKQRPVRLRFRLRDASLYSFTMR